MYIYIYIYPLKMYIYICNIVSKRHNILPTRTSFFISSAGTKSQTFRVAVNR